VSTSVVIEGPPPEPIASAGGPSVPARMWDLLRGSPAALIGAPIVLLFTLVGLAGIVLLHVPGLAHLWTDQDLASVLKPPGTNGHLLGTDELGRDLFWRAVAGTGLSFELGLAVTAATLLIGGTVGIVAGYYGGLADRAIGAIIDVTWGFPLILLAVMVAGALSPGFLSILIAVAALNWAGFARIIRGYALSLREQEFVDAARALGIPAWRILLRHFVPNVIAPILVMGSYYVGVTIIVEAGVSFLGLGIQSPTPSLGAMIADGRNTLSFTIWPALVPGAAIALAVTGFSLLGDGLRDTLDPRLQRPLR
jgi:peptide/nickel transport system permease protein